MATITLRSSQSVPLTNNQLDANFNNINTQLEQVVNITIPTLAPKASPAFSGTPTTPTASPGTNTLQVASTAFVYKELEARKSAALPAMSGIAAIGTTDRFAREDHVHPTDTNVVRLEGSQTIDGVKTLTRRLVTSGSADPYTVGGWRKGLELSLANSIFWPKGESTYSKAIGASNTDHIFFIASDKDDGSGQVLTPFTFDMANGTLLCTNLTANVTGNLISNAPTAPTQPPNTNNNSIATTAFVISERTNTTTLANKTITGTKEIKVTGGTGGNYSVDMSIGNYFTRTFNSNATITVSNVPASGTAQSFIFEITNAGSYSITWMPNTKWAFGVAPQLTANGRDILGFYTHDAGTTWNGLVLAKDIK